MHPKGFNLFTALISFLLIMLAVLLIQSMIQTERNAADTIGSIEARSELEATAEMARADSIQVFNYALRKKIEDWLTDPERGGITLQLQDKTWQEIQNEFAESKFGGEEGSQFAKFAASSLEGIFYSPSHFGNYLISLEGSETLEAGIKQAMAKSVEEGFFTVIECNGDPRGSNCPLGTFYVNLHIEKLTQEEYENLPKLHVVDKRTGEELKEVILPRTTFRIYVPLRFFKAIAEARALTHFPLEVKPDSQNDLGLFSPRVHNEIESIALGMCDFGYCRPRTDPLAKPDSKEFSGTGTFCPGDNTSPSWGSGLLVRIESDLEWMAGIDGTTYNANNNDDWANLRETVSKVGKAKACDVIRQARALGYIDAVKNDQFDLVGKECAQGEEMLAYDISINSDAMDSKAIGKESSEAKISDPGRSLGLYVDSETGNVEFPTVGGIEALGCTNSGYDIKSRCAEVKSVKATLAFRETNPNYMVREAKEGEERLYRISVYDNTYIPFTANWEQGNINALTRLYSKPPETTNCSMAPGYGWNCITTIDYGDMKDLKAIGCKPAEG